MSGPFCLPTTALAPPRCYDENNVDEPTKQLGQPELADTDFTRVDAGVYALEHCKVSAR